VREESEEAAVWVAAEEEVCGSCAEYSGGDGVVRGGKGEEAERGIV
jgi:hypothetical protein